MSTSNKGIFISFEGIDGCGKSTQVKLLIDRMYKDGIDSILVREPGGIELSEDIRTILLNNRNSTMSSRTEALLMTASRAQLTKRKIIPALENGTCVIADRFKDSTLAYQGGGRGLNINSLINLNNFATYELDPAITIFLDVSVEVALQRSNKSNPDRIESEGVNFQNNVRNCYLTLANKFPNRIIKINGANSIEVIHRTIWGKIINYFND